VFTKTTRRVVASLLSAAMLAGPVAPAFAKSVDELVGVAALARLNLQKIAVQQAAAALIAESRDVDGDGYYESPSMLVGGGPAGGGLIPLSSAAPKDDSYGTKLGYCAFDNGGATSLVGHIPGSANNVSAPVLAVVTAGADNVFQTSCSDIAASVSNGSGTGVKGDDYVISYNTTQLKLGLSGSLYFGDPVDSSAALTQLASNPTSLHVGEVRLTKDDNSLHSWTGSEWKSVSGQGKPWAASVAYPDSYFGATPYYSSSPVVIGGDHVPTNALTLVDDTGRAPLGITGTAGGNGIQFFDVSDPETAVASIIIGSASGDMSLNAIYGGAIKLGWQGGDYAVFDSNGATVNGTLSSAGNIYSGGDITAGGIFTAGGGTPAAPAYTFSGRTGAGLYYDSAKNAIGLSNEGAPVLKIRVSSVAIGAGALENTTISLPMSVAVGDGALASNVIGWQNTAIGHTTLNRNLTGGSNVAVGAGALSNSESGSGNTAVGFGSMASASGANLNNNAAFGVQALPVVTSGSNNAAFGSGVLGSLQTGSSNVAVGDRAGRNVTAGASNTFLGEQTGLSAYSISQADNMTLVGSKSTAVLPSSGGYMTAIGAGSVVSSANTVVLGRVTDKTVIGSTGDSGSAALLQITGATQHIGLTTPPPVSAGLIYYDSNANQFRFSNGTNWANLSSPALSQITAATANNTLDNGANQQVWNWKLAADNSSALTIGETTASTGGGASQSLVSIGTLAGSTARPLTIRSRGIEVLRVSATSPQILVSSGTVTAPGLGFLDGGGAGLYAPANNQFAATIWGQRAFFLSDANTALGIGAGYVNAVGSGNVSIGAYAHSANASGSGNIAIGDYAASYENRGQNNVALGYRSGLDFNSLLQGGSGYKTTMLGSNASYSASIQGQYMTAVGADSLVTSNNTVVLGRTTDKTVIGATAENGSGNRLQVTGGLQVVTGNVTSAAGQFLAAAGGSGNPAYSFVGNTNSGMYAPATSELALSVSGARSMWLAGPRVALGSGALGVSTAPNGTAIGFNALANNTVGTSNTAVGYSTLSNNTTGGGNSALGYSALQANVSGFANAAVGRWTLSTNVSGSQNTAAGDSALANNTSGSYNSAFGSGAGYSNSGGGGSYMTLIGAETSARPGGTPSGDLYMTAIGGGTTVTTLNTIVLGRTSDTTVIGATGDNGTGNRLQVTGGIQAVSGNITNSAGQFLGAGGSTSAPTYAFSGDTDTGIYSPGSGRIAMAVDGSRVFFVTSDISHQIALGGGALEGNTSTFPNVAIGWNAMNANTGANNIGIGTDALRRNTGGGNVGIGASVLQNNTGGSNTGVGNGALQRNASGYYNTATGSGALAVNDYGSYNVANGAYALMYNSTGSYNVSVGYQSLQNNTTGSANVVIGNGAMLWGTTGNNNVVVGSGAMSNMATLANQSNYITLVGSDTSATPSVAGSAYMTAIGAKSVVTTFNTVVLGRPTDKTVIGATGENGSSALLQVNGAMQLVGTSVEPVGTPGMLYYDSTLGRLRVYQGNAWRSANSGPISDLTGAIADNSISNGVFQQAWKWSLNGDGKAALSIGEDAPSMGGAGAQYLMNVGTLAGSTAIPFAVSSQGTEVFRVDATRPQLLINGGSLNAPAIAFLSDKGIGFYKENYSLAAALGGIRYMSLAENNIAFGNSALLAPDQGVIGNVAIGNSALRSSTGGNYNVAIGAHAGRGITTGSDNIMLGRFALRGGANTGSTVAIGAQALAQNASGMGNVGVGENAFSSHSSGSSNTALGYSAGASDSNVDGGNTITLLGAFTTAALPSATTGDLNMTAVGAGATVSSVNTVVLGRSADSVVVGQATAGPYQFFVNGTAGGTSAYAVSSDRRFKRDIKALVDPLDVIKHLQGVSYEFNHEAFPERKFESGRQIGFIAQQIEPFVPEIVRTDKDGFKSVQYSQLVPLLVEGIKAQQGILQHLLRPNTETLSVDIKTFQAQDVIVENFKAGNVRAAMVEADNARIKHLQAETIESKSVRSDLVKSGDAAVYVPDGTFQPIFSPSDNSQYLVNAVAEDGTIAFASVAVVNGNVIVKPVNNTAVDIIARGGLIGLVAANMRVKATWIRLG
jgi:hypothetical protein